MSDSVCNLPMGRVTSDAYALAQLGVEAYFLDIDYAEQNPLPAPVTSARRRCILVRNTGAGTLAAGAFVTWKAGKAGTEVDAVAGIHATPAGQVDPFLSAAVAIGESFWMIVEGPTQVTAAETIAAGNGLRCAASGKVSVGTTNVIGHALEAATYTDTDVVVRAYIDCPAVGSLAGSAGILPAVQDTRAGAGAVSITTYYTNVTTASAAAITLANGSFIGQLKKIQMTVDGGDATLTMTGQSGASTVVFANVGEFVLLQWNGAVWVIVERGNATTGVTPPSIS